MSWQSESDYGGRGQGAHHGAVIFFGGEGGRSIRRLDGFFFSFLGGIWGGGREEGGERVKG